MDQFRALASGIAVDSRSVIAVDSRSGVAPGHYGQYCHWLRATLGVVHRMAVLPIAAPPDPAPAIATHAVGLTASAAKMSARPRASAIVRAQTVARRAQRRAKLCDRRSGGRVIAGGGSGGAAIGNAAIRATMANTHGGNGSIVHSAPEEPPPAITSLCNSS